MIHPMGIDDGLQQRSYTEAFLLNTMSHKRLAKESHLSFRISMTPRWSSALHHVNDTIETWSRLCTKKDIFSLPPNSAHQALTKRFLMFIHLQVDVLF